MKRITNEEILDTVYDLADALGVRIDVLIERIVEEFGEQPYPVDGLPEEVVNELTAAREDKKARRADERIRREQESAREEIKRFREFFPEIKADDIPEAVWADVENGIPLCYAYALYITQENNATTRASEVNERNGLASLAAASDGVTEPVFTKEAVEKMSDSDVKRNYKSILRAMKSWRV